MAGDRTTVCAAKQLSERQAQRRQAPYTRRIRNPRPSLTDNIISICSQLSKPLFGRSPGRSQDVFSVPWRTVDRETAELREELYRAQHQSESETEPITEPITESIVEPAAEPIVEPEAEAAAESVAESVVEQGHATPEKSPYESVFDTVRKMAEARSQEAESPLAGKGKEAELAEDEDDEDFEPIRENDDDDEEEDLQRDMEPIDEEEEVTTASAKDVTTEAVPDTREESVGISVVEEPSSADVSDEEVVEPDVVEEPQSSEVVSESEQELVESEEAESEEVESGDEEEEDARSEEDEEAVSVAIVYEDDDDSDAGSVDSDQATEELASIASAESVSLGEVSEAESDAEESTQPLPESPAEPAAPATPAQQALLQQTPSLSRKWWPFSGSSFLGSLMDTQKRKQLHSDSQETVAEAPALASPTFGQRRMPPKSASKPVSRPFVPASFIDVTKDAITEAGKRVRVPEHSTLKRHALLGSRRHTAILPAQFTPISSASPSAETVRLSPSPKTQSSSSSRLTTPLITAASLGLEARRNAARGHGRLQRRRTGMYYGSGYGSRSTPYAFTPARSAPAATGNSSEFTAAGKDVSPSASVAGESLAGNRSSSTAQRILDIIGEVPPTRSQVGQESHDAVNPYELSSPYSVRMRPTTAQRRRVLVPLSARLSQAAEGKKPSPDSQSAKAILESIQSAAPPAIQARLGAAAPKAGPPRADVAKQPVLTATLAPQPKKTQPKKTVDVTPPPPTTAQISTPSTTFRPAAVAATPTKTQVLAKPAQAPAKKTEPMYSFSLPSPVAGSQIHEAAKARVSSLAVTELPTFLFTLDGKQAAPATEAPMGADKSWECEVCELKSPATADKCVVCDSARPAAKTSVPAVSGAEWECAVCELKSPATADKCIVCDASKPVAMPGASKPTVPVSAGAEWECAMCELKSPATADKCIVCDAPRPAAKPSASKPAAPSSTLAPVSASKEWECGVCELKSPATADKCIVCDAAKPAAKPSASKPT
ncbi:hypothetical protein GGF43_003916, partial [Coemansia sp. RSA 2618]